MIIIGLVLLIVAAVFGLDLMWKNTFHIQNPVVFGQSLSIHSASVFFLVGAITGAVLILGIALVLAGVRLRGHKIVRHHRERKEASNTQAARTALESDNTALRHELDEQQTVQPPVRQPDPVAQRDPAMTPVSEQPVRGDEQGRAPRA